MTDRRAIAILFCGNLAGLAGLALVAPRVTPDGSIYLAWADHIRAAGLAAMPGIPEKFLPLYPALIAALTAVTGGALSAETAGRALAALAGAALPPLIYALGRRMGATLRPALVLALAASLLAVGLDQYRDVNVMPLFTAELAGCLLLVARGNFLFAGIVAGLAVTTRFEAYLILPALALAFRRRPRLLLRFGAGLAAAAAPWWVRNLVMYGSLFHTYYMAELTAVRFNLQPMLLGTLLEFSPLALVAAAAGARRLPRETLVLPAAFMALYLALHTVWWFYRDHFLLPLAPLFYPAAAVGLAGWLEAVAGKDWTPMRKRAAAGLLIAAILCPAAGRAGWFVWLAPKEETDPYVLAARALRNEPAEVLALGSNAFLLERVSGRPPISFDGLPADTDPHRLAAEAYLRGARLLIWENLLPADARIFGFLRDAGRHRALVELPSGRFELIYVFYREYRRGPNRVLVYDLLMKPAAPELK